jgi:hypothetical protein
MAHEVGLPTTATIMFGHVDSPRNWARHLLAVRVLQQRTGGITEFVPLPFVHMEAPIYLKGRPCSSSLRLCTSSTGWKPLYGVYMMILILLSGAHAQNSLLAHQTCRIGVEKPSVGLCVRFMSTSGLPCLTDVLIGQYQALQDRGNWCRSSEEGPHAARVLPDARGGAAGPGQRATQHTGVLGEDGPRARGCPPALRLQRHGRLHHE